MRSSVGLLRPLRRLVEPRARVWMGVVGSLRLVERVLLAAAALSFSTERAPVAIAITVLLGLVAALRAAARAPLLARIRRRFVVLVTEALLGPRVLSSTAKREEETELVLFEALWSAEELAAERVPGLVADVVAAALLSVLLVSRLPGSLVAVGLVVLAFAALAAEAARRIATKEAQRSWDTFLPLASSVEACIHGSLELVGNGRDRAQRGLVRARTEAWVRRAWRADWLAGLSGRVPLLVGLVGVVAAIVYAQTARGMTAEAALAEGLLVASFLPPFAGVLTNLVELSTANPKLAPLKDLVADRADPLASRGAALPPPPTTTLRWERIDYAYPLGEGRGQRVLSGASGEARPGRVVALAGPNGAGKSTLLRLLLGLDRPERGSIFVGDAALEDIDRDAWRERVAFLPQRPYLPTTATVREAMRFLAPEASDGEMTRALERVALWRRLRAEPDRAPLDVVVGALSAGERQRLALARVLLKDASVVMLDEPDANLDRSGVKLLAELLRELAMTKTVLMVAHDEELLGLADDVLRVKGSWPAVLETTTSAVGRSATA